MLKNMLDSKNTFTGKLLAVFMSVALMMSMTSATAFAASENARPGASASNTAPAESASSTSADEAVVSFETQNVQVSVKGKVLSDATLRTELHKELQFTASADAGFRLGAITAKNAANTNVPVTTKDGTFTIAAEYVDSTLVVSVPAIPVATNAPGEETKPITGDTGIENGEGEAATEGEQPARPEGESEVSRSAEASAPSESLSPLALDSRAAAPALQGYTATVVYFDAKGLYEREESVPRQMPAGEITKDTVPAIDGYQFMGAYVGNGKIAYAGKLDGKTYYTAAGSLESGIAMELMEGQRIDLTYQSRANKHEITYNVQASDGSKTSTITGPEYVDNNGTLHFTLNVPRGYKLKGDVTANGRPVSATEGVYAVQNVTEDMKVVATVEKIAAITINATTKGSPDNFHSARFTSNSETAKPENRGFVDTVPVGEGGASYTFGLQSGISNSRWYSWQLNSLQINNVYIAVPTTYTAGSTASSVLPGGTKITVTLVEVQRPEEKSLTDYIYTIAVEGAQEDITVSRGNFRGSEHAEVMPRYGEGITLQSRTKTIDPWEDVISSKPIQTEHSYGAQGAFFRIKLKPAFKSLDIMFNGKKTELTNMPKYTVDSEWAYFTIDDIPGGLKLQTLEIYASRIGYQVSYDANGGDTAPSDSTTYDLVSNTSILVSPFIPTKGKEIFVGWKINGKGDTVYPEDVLEVKTLVDNGLFDAHNTISLVAQWAAAPTAGAKVVVPVENYYQNDKGLYPDKPTSKDSATGYAGASIVKIKPDPPEIAGYEYDNDAPNISSGKVLADGSFVLKQYYKRIMRTLTYDANGATEGKVPADPTAYGLDQTVWVRDNTGALNKPGYRFIGWNTSAAGDGTAYAPGGTLNMSSDNVTLYAQWKPSRAKISVWFNSSTEGGPAYFINTDGQLAQTGDNKYTFNIDSEHKSGYPEGDLKVYAAQAYKLTPETDRYDGYEIWVTHQRGGEREKIANLESYAIQDGDEIRYHVIPSVAHSVTYVPGEQGEGKPFVEKDQYFKGDKVAARANLEGTGITAKPGYVFGGWKSSDVETIADGSFAMPKTSVTFTASWNKLYNVTYSWTGLPEGVQFYNEAGGKVDTPSVPKSVTGLAEGAHYTVDSSQVGTVLYTHDASGKVTASYTLGAWSDPNSGTVGKSDVEIKASWGVAYPVTYEYAGNVPKDAPRLPATVQYAVDQPVQVAPAPSAEGYTFEGWSVGNFNMPAKGVVITGTWKADFSKLAAQGVSKVYNGEASSIKVAGVSEGDVVKLNVEGKEIENSFVNVNQSAQVSVEVTRGTETWRDRASVAITPAELTIGTAGATKVYDGTPLTATGITIEGMVGSEKLVARTTGTVTEVTSADGVNNTYELDWSNAGTTAKESNYAVKKETLGKLVVSDAAYTVESQSYVGAYDGKPHGITVKVPANATVKYDTANSYTDVTTGAVTVHYTVTRPNYKTITGSETVTITPAPLKVSAINTSKKYGEGEPELKYDTSSSVGSETPAFSGALKRAEGEKVGDYPIGQGSLVLTDNPPTGFKASNYALSFVPATFTIAPASGNVVNVDDASLTKTYDGKPTSLSATATKTGSTLLYSVDGGKTWSEKNPSFTDAGTYTVQVKATNPNFEDTPVVSTTVTVNKASATITVANTSKIYGAADPAFTGAIKGLVSAGDLGEVAYKRTNTEESVGTYAEALTATYTANKNYEVVVQKGTFEITAQTISINNEPTDVVYNGKEQKWAPRVTDASGKVLVEGKDYTVSYGGDTKGVGAVSVTIKGAGNYTGTLERSYRITPAAAKIKVNDASKVYGDKDPAFTGAIEGLLGTDTLGDISYSRTNDDNTVGTYVGTLTASVAKANPNYTYSVVPGTFTIVPAGGNVVNIDPAGLTKTYDGKPTSLSATATQTGSTLLYSVDGGKTWSEKSPSFTDAGTYTVQVKATNPNYNDSAVVSTTVTINKASATITVANASKIYGAADPAFTGTIKGLVSAGDLGEVAYKRTNTVENVGTYAGVLTATYTANKNYEVVVQNGTFEIMAGSISVNEAADVVYNGQEQKWAPSVTDKSGKTLVKGVDYTVSYSDDVTHVGTVSVSIESTGNYTGTVERTYRITPAAAVIVVNDSSKKFDQADPSFSGSVKGLFGSDTLGTVAYSRTNKDEAVGTYKDVLSATVSSLNSNYTYTVKPGSFTISSSSANTVRVTSGEKSLVKTYDAKATSITAEADVKGSTLLYSVDGGKTWSEKNPSFTDAGSYTVQVKATHEGYEDTAPVSATIVINKAPVTITVASAVKEYGSPDPAFTGSVEGLVAAGDLGDITYVRTSRTENAGYYVGILTAAYTPNKNYAVEVKSGSFAITPQAMTVNEPADVVYNGQEQKWVPRVTDKSGKVLVEGKDYTVSYSGDTKGVGTVKVSIKDGGNYVGAVDRTYRITAAAATIKVRDASKVYGDKDPAFTGTIEGLHGTDSLGDVSYRRTNDAEAAGTYPGTLVATVAKANPNYTYSVVPGAFTITPAAGNIVHIDDASLTKTYDGKPTSLSATATKPGSTLHYSVDGGKTWSEKSPSFTDAGSYTVQVKATNPNFDETPVVSTNVVINKAPATITVAGASKVYGSADPAFTGTVKGLVSEGDLGEVAYKRTNTDENVGTYVDVLTATFTPNKNYEVTVQKGTFEITAGAFTVSNKPSDVVYNGQEQKWAPRVVDKSGNVLVEGKDYTVSYGGDTKGAGTVSVTIKGTGNYTGTVEYTYQITAAAARIKVNDASKAYGDKDPAFTGAIEGLIGADSLGDVSYSRTNDAEEVGTYAGTLTAAVTNTNPNYTYTVTPGTFTITPAGGNVVNIDPTGLTKTYDGKPTSLSATATKPGSTLLYSPDGKTWSETVPSFTDAGSYTVYVKATNPNFDDTPAISTTVVINKASATIKVNDASKTYGDKDPAFTGAIEGLIGADSLGDVSYSRTNDAEEVGTYAGTLTAAVTNTNPNYTYTVTPGTFTITPAGGNVVNIDPTGLTKTYDGKPTSLSATATKPGSTLLYSPDGKTWSETVPSFTDAGSYTVYVKATNPNFDDTPAISTTVVINKASVTIKVNDATKVMGAADPTFTGTISGLVAEGDLGEVTYSRTNTDEAVGTYTNALSATYADNPNYKITVVNGTFTITAAPVTPGTPSPATPTPLPTLGTVPPNSLFAPLAKGLANTAETILGDNADPSAKNGQKETEIGDNKTPLTGEEPKECWVHFYMIDGILITIIYATFVTLRRRRFTNKLKNYENDLIEGDGPDPGAPASAPQASDLDE